jgi:hypothetical protein
VAERNIDLKAVSVVMIDGTTADRRWCKSDAPETTYVGGADYL